ncbi:MAG: hypothetical protein GXZ07_00330 [Firmicutes bacterium]|nr:hypothetical protein [Bacillota bacterium]
MPRKEERIQQYLEETIQALLPVYDGDGSGSLVYTRKNRFRDSRSLPWLVNRLAHYFSLDLAVLRKRSASLLNQKHHLSIPLSPDLILLPVKVRQAALQGETTIAYISLTEIENLQEIKDNPPYKSAILLHGGRVIKSLHGVSSLRERIRQGELVGEDFRSRRKSTAAVTGLDSSELLSALPGCTCFLKDLFTAVVSLAAKAGSF